MTIRARIFTRALCAVVALAAVFCGAGAQADERSLPVPKATIYPGDPITDALLEERTFLTTAGDTTLIGSRSDLTGKVARRTLLPGKPISVAAVDSPRVVSAGAHVKLIFNEGGLIITTYGTALQPGAVGDVIRVRNLDSGLSVSGRVQADGAIRVSEG
jgi:flagellar basal body P-ring formation protein FlgA